MAKKANPDRVAILKMAPRARCVGTDKGYEIRNPDDDDCYERGYSVLSDEAYPTPVEAWRAAAEFWTDPVETDPEFQARVDAAQPSTPAPAPE